MEQVLDGLPDSLCFLRSDNLLNALVRKPKQFTCISPA